MWNALDRLDLVVEHLLDLWDVRTGYPYRTDPTVLPPYIAGVDGGIAADRGRKNAPKSRSSPQRTSGSGDDAPALLGRGGSRKRMSVAPEFRRN